jgi:hypothetical protein
LQVLPQSWQHGKASSQKSGWEQGRDERNGRRYSIGSEYSFFGFQTVKECGRWSCMSSRQFSRDSRYEGSGATPEVKPPLRTRGPSTEPERISSQIRERAIPPPCDVTHLFAGEEANRGERGPLSASDRARSASPASIGYLGTIMGWLVRRQIPFKRRCSASCRASPMLMELFKQSRQPRPIFQSNLAASPRN